MDVVFHMRLQGSRFGENPGKSTSRPLDLTYPEVDERDIALTCDSTETRANEGSAPALPFEIWACLVLRVPLCW